MRITGGKYVRRQVQCPPGVIRPAMDRMRESLFSILGDLSGLSFLDLYSGSGCVAIEAASRGADPVHLVEMDRGKKATIEKNLSFVEENHRLFMMDALQLSILQAADKGNAVKDSGLFIIHIPTEERKLWPETEGSFSLTDERKYGRSILLFYRKEAKDVQNR